MLPFRMANLPDVLARNMPGIKGADEPLVSEATAVAFADANVL